MSKPELLTTLFVVFVGMSVGSFINALAYRWPRGLSIVVGRSRCSRCGCRIAWYDNLPVVSFIVLLGRCRLCGWPFGASHAVVEALMGVGAWALYQALGCSWQMLYWFVLLAALVLMSLIDLAFRLIPDEISLGGLAIGLVVAIVAQAAAFSWTVTWPDALAGALLGGGTLWLLAWVYEFFLQREGMGMGDVKLLAMLGVHLGVEGVFAVMFLASLMGGLVGATLLVTSRMTRTTPIPFGPFLAGGFGLVWTAQLLGWKLWLL